MRQEGKILIAWVVAATVQIAWHLFLSTDSEVARSLLRFYLSYDPKIGKGVAGWFDLVLPCMWLGFCVGLFGWNWSVLKISVFVASSAIVVVVLLPIYPEITKLQNVWWWPSKNKFDVAILTGEFVKAVLILGVFCYGGREFGKYGSSKHSNVSPIGGQNAGHDAK
jgi:hypothetical protein